MLEYTHTVAGKSSSNIKCINSWGWWKRGGVQYKVSRGILKPLMLNEERGKTRLQTEEKPNDSLCRLSASLICSECRLLARDELKMRVKTTQLPGLRGEERRGEERRGEERRGEEERGQRRRIKENLSLMTLRTAQTAPSVHQCVYQFRISIWTHSSLQCIFALLWQSVFTSVKTASMYGHGPHSADSIPTRPAVKTTTLPLFFKKEKKKGNSMN